MGMLSNREYSLSWPWEELRTISDEIQLPHCIHQKSGHKVWNNHVFLIPKKVISVETEMIEATVRKGLFKPTWGPYRNTIILVPKQNRKYRVMIPAMSAMRYTLEGATILPVFERFSEAFAGQPISALIDSHARYDQNVFTRLTQTIWPSSLHSEGIGRPDW